MKTIFLVKLLLLSLTCSTLISCTVDEDISKSPTQTTNQPSAKDGDPLIPNPK